MTTAPLSAPSAFRNELMARGGRTVTRCYQCATCSSVCELAQADAPFPRRQMLLAQWGQSERLLLDPAIWLCHQCNDCTTRCPREARPGDVMQALRSFSIEQVAVPRLLGRFVGRIAVTWPLVLGLPLLFWAAFVYAFNGSPGWGVPENLSAFDQFVPHWMVYLVNIPVFTLAFISVGISGSRLWRQWGEDHMRRGSFGAALLSTCIDIARHQRFAKCGTAAPRRRGHFLFMWGFIGAFITTGLVLVWYYGFGTALPFALTHPLKILGNLSALLLVVGAALLLIHRLSPDESAGRATAFDNFFLFLMLCVVVTGIFTEVSREFLDNARLACFAYLFHLGVNLCLFMTLPYSKLAHFVYRTLAITHERMMPGE